MIAPSTDEQRCVQLRSFLMQARSRLTPAEVGLPETARRRVTGLRREEVAELAGVSSDWYRWFESGRPIHASALFLTRLARALRLSRMEQQTFYYLAVTNTEETGPDVLHGTQLLTPIQAFDDIESVIRRLAAAKIRFFSDSSAPLPEVRPRIVKSWRRSLQLGVNPLRDTVPASVTSDDELRVARNASKPLLDAAAPTVARLRSLLGDSGFALIVADALGCVLEIDADRDTARALSKIDFEPGGDLSESGCGTNAIGTALADGRALQLVGAENYVQGGSDLTCTGAPIRDPSSMNTIGAIDVTANYRRIHPELLSLVSDAALEIEERLIGVH